MPGYTKYALLRFQYPYPIRPDHVSCKYNAPNYIQQLQMEPPIDNFPVIYASGKTWIQKF
eukprot:15345971-Ditylum_brightwellii.AAC.1